MGPIPVPVDVIPSKSSIAVVILFMILGGWKLMDILVWISDHIYFIW